MKQIIAVICAIAILSSVGVAHASPIIYVNEQVLEGQEVTVQINNSPSKNVKVEFYQKGSFIPVVKKLTTYKGYTAASYDTRLMTKPTYVYSPLWDQTSLSVITKVFIGDKTYEYVTKVLLMR